MTHATFGRLPVLIGRSTEEMAARAAADFAAAARLLLGRMPEINVVFSGAESQAAFHAALRDRQDIPWPSINAFSVDEFYAPGMPAECAVSAQPRRDLYGHVPLASVNVIDFAASDADTESRRYASLVESRPPHICCLGIGISGHIALNEPGDTSFEDTRTARVVRIVEESRRQLAADPNFRSLPAIPERGITLTIPFLLRASRLIVVVPFALKASIVARLRDAPVSPAFPASILTTRPDATLYLDPGSAAGLEPAGATPSAGKPPGTNPRR